jgi:hypothetical protein
MKIRHFLKNNILRFRSAVVGATKYWKQQNIENYLKIENLKTDILTGQNILWGVMILVKLMMIHINIFVKALKKGRKFI